MRGSILMFLLLGSAAALLLVRPARADYGADYLLGYDIVIADDGRWHESWESGAQRVYAQVNSGRGSRDYYFSDIASAFFVLREEYGEPIPMRELLVGDSAVQRSRHETTRLLDGRLAWYFWDEDRLLRGGLPLILAFHSELDARDRARYRNGRVLDFTSLTRALRDWISDYGPRCYWRGKGNWSNSGWQRAWDRRWDGWGMDDERGWVSLRNRRHDPRPAVLPYLPPPRNYRDDWREREREREWREREERERYERERREREERERQRVERDRREREERERAERERREREEREKRDRERREREEREKKDREERERRERARQIEEAPPKSSNPPQKQPEKNPPPPRKE